MKPAIVMPFHDPDGLMLAHLEAITPQLKGLFERAFISVTHPTRQRQPGRIEDLEQDAFFHLVYPHVDALVGEHFRSLYASAAATCPPDQLLHLCFIDRVAFALQGEHRPQFVEDIQAVTEEGSPLLFQRSEKAWATHPQNYREIEHMVTRVGELLFNQTLDLAWCHLVLSAHDLGVALPSVRRSDLSVLAEIALAHRERIKTRDVDWLAWEDPFVYGQNAAQLKAEREADVQETLKRLSYVLPKLRLLAEAGRG